MYMSGNCGKSRAYSTARFLARFLEARKSLSEGGGKIQYDRATRAHVCAETNMTMLTLEGLRTKQEVCRLNAYRLAFRDKTHCVTVINPRLQTVLARDHAKPDGAQHDILILRRLEARKMVHLPALQNRALFVPLVESVVLRSPVHAPLLTLASDATIVHCTFADILPQVFPLRFVHTYTVQELQTVMQVTKLVNSITLNLEMNTLLPANTRTDPRRVCVWRITLCRVNMSVLWTLTMMLEPMKSQLHYTLTIGRGEQPTCTLEYAFK